MTPKPCQDSNAASNHGARSVRWLSDALAIIIPTSNFRETSANSDYASLVTGFGKCRTDAAQIGWHSLGKLRLVFDWMQGRQPCQNTEMAQLLVAPQKMSWRCTSSIALFVPCNDLTWCCSVCGIVLLCEARLESNRAMMCTLCSMQV